MRLTREIDPQRAQKYRRTYYAAHRDEFLERGRRRMADPEKRARRDSLLRLRDRTEEVLSMRQAEGRFTPAASQARAARFDQINAYRKQGLSYIEIDKLMGVYSSKHHNARSQEFMASAKNTWRKGNADGRLWAANRDPETVKVVYRFMTSKRDLFADMQAALEADKEFQLLRPDAIYQDGWYNGVCEFHSPSHKARARFERLPVIRNRCENCGIQFEGRLHSKFCSQKCRSSVYYRQIDKPRRVSKRASRRPRSRPASARLASD